MRREATAVHSMLVRSGSNRSFQDSGLTDPRQPSVARPPSETSDGQLEIAHLSSLDPVQLKPGALSGHREI
mgnify:CR=1 FL=1